MSIGDIPEASVDDYKYLIGTTHRDDKDKLLYLVTKVYRQRKSGYIVADSVLILSDGSNHKIPDHLPTHVRDIEILTKRFEEETNTLPLRCNLSHLVTNSVISLPIPNDDKTIIEHTEIINTSDDMYCNLIHRHSDYDVYHDELNMEDFNKLITSHQRGDPLSEFVYKLEVM